MSHDPRDTAFIALLEAARRFNRAPSYERRDAVEAAARELVVAHEKPEATAGEGGSQGR